MQNCSKLRECPLGGGIVTHHYNGGPGGENFSPADGEGSSSYNDRPLLLPATLSGTETKKEDGIAWPEATGRADVPQLLHRQQEHQQADGISAVWEVQPTVPATSGNQGA